MGGERPADDPGQSEDTNDGSDVDAVERGEKAPKSMEEEVDLAQKREQESPEG